MYVRLYVQYIISAFEYAITNCHQLKYLYYDSGACVTLPSSSNCHLQQLCVESYAIKLSVPSVQVLSAHGGLEKVALFVKSITTSAITTLISNSPYLILLYIVTGEPLCDGAIVVPEDYKDTVQRNFLTASY